MLFTECKVLPVPVDLIGKSPLRIMPGTLLISSEGSDQYIRFIVGIKRKSFQTYHALLIDAQIQLCPEFHGRCGFPLTIGLMYGWLMLTMRSGTECTLFSYMYCCCSYT